MPRTVKYVNPRLATDNWYYVQVFPHTPGPLSIEIICFAPTKEAAQKRTTEWLKSRNLVPREIHLYLKNYKRDADKMVSAGNYITA